MIVICSMNLDCGTKSSDLFWLFIAAILSKLHIDISVIAQAPVKLPEYGNLVST